MKPTLIPRSYKIEQEIRSDCYFFIQQANYTGKLLWYIYLGTQPEPVPWIKPSETAEGALQNWLDHYEK